MNLKYSEFQMVYFSFWDTREIKVQLCKQNDQ